MNSFISICIPAYKNTAYLDVLLRSVEIQSFRDFEVIVSDDSPDSEVEMLCKQYNTKFPLTYHKNSPALGSPANWNMSIKPATGQWIKLMHDDDWFADENSLQVFATAAEQNSDAGFIFSGYSNYENGQLKNTNIPGSFIENKLKSSPLNLIAKNYIGHPSNTLIKNNLELWYDERTKWVVDFEFYIRCLQTSSFYVIQKPLINIGIGDEQITRAVFNDSAVVIPENLYLLNKMGTGILHNITVYDHYWRVFRNLNIRNMAEVEKHAGNNEIPRPIKKMLKLQFKIPLVLLRIGVFSKMLMAISYYSN